MSDISIGLYRQIDTTTQVASVASGSYTPNVFANNTFFITLDANVTVNAPISVGQQNARLTLIFQQDSIGGRTVTFNATFKNTSNFQLNSAANGFSAITFYQSKADGNWYAAGGAAVPTAPTINVTVKNLTGVAVSTFFGNVNANATTSFTVAEALLEAGINALEVQRKAGTISWWTDAELKARWFGVVGDGVTDDTAAVQAALNAAYAAVSANNGIILSFPSGDFKITSTLLVKGTASQGPCLRGSPPGNAFGQQVTRFRWYGATGGKLMHTEAFNKGLIEDIAFDGRSVAGILLHIDSMTYVDQTVLAATSGAVVQRCSFKHVQAATSGNGCVALGSSVTPNTQASEVVFRDCDFEGEDSTAGGFVLGNMQAYGFRTLSGANCKNFHFDSCNWDFCKIAVDWTNSSGYMTVIRPNMGEVMQAFAQGTAGQLTVIGGDIENKNVTDFRLIKSGAANQYTASFTGMEIFVNLAGGTGTLIEFYGQLDLRRNTFFENTHKAFILKIWPSVVGSSGGYVKSEGNWYAYCGSANSPYAPFTDSAGNDYTNGATARFQNWSGIESIGDAGGPSGSIIPFHNVRGQPLEVPFLKPFQTGYTLGDLASAPTFEGQHRRVTIAQKITYSDVKTSGGGGSAAALRLTQYWPDLRLVDAWARIDTAYAGVTTLTMEICKGGGDTEDYMLSQSVKQPAGTRLGVTDAQRGHVFKPGDPRYQSGGEHFVDASGYIYTRFIGDGAMNNLNAGQVTVFLTYEFLG